MNFTTVAGRFLEEATLLDRLEYGPSKQIIDTNKIEIAR